MPSSWWIIIKFNTSFTDIFVSCDNNRRLAILCDTDIVGLTYTPENTLIKVPYTSAAVNVVMPSELT